MTQRALRAASWASDHASPFRYNITTSAQHKFLWFRVAKVGSRTIFARMRDQGVQFDLEAPYRIRYSPKAYVDHFKFAFVRNPWHRLLSCWHNKVLKQNYFRFPDDTYRKMQDFEYFVDWVAERGVHSDDPHIKAQSSLIDLNNCDYLGRMETFEKDLSHIFGVLGLDQTSRVTRNVSKKRKSYEDYYTPELIDKVAEIYRMDVQMFGYDYSA